MDKVMASERTVTRVPSGKRGMAISSLTAAFIKDPLVRYMYPDAEAYLAHAPALFDAYAGCAVDHEMAFEAGDYSALAMWMPPGEHADGDVLGALLEKTMRPELLGPTFEILGQMEAHHPEEPHWFLPMIGVDPVHQGKGLGGALLADMCKRLDAENALAYLDSSNVLNIPLYERHGFVVVDEIRMDGLPPVWPMLRRPRGG
jgi:ribosomal protein S18 acetylase RimI-like enzyme